MRLYTAYFADFVMASQRHIQKKIKYTVKLYYNIDYNIQRFGHSVEGSARRRDARYLFFNC
jgi:hypothetical protein